MKNPSKKVLVIIPAYNEEATIGKVVSDVRAHAPEAGILVIDDGSVDSTASVAGKARATVVTHPYNLGIGAAMQTGYRYALKNGFDIGVQVDADGQHPAMEIEGLVAGLLEGNADLAVGSRFLGRGDYRPGLARGTGIAVFSRVISAIVGTRLTDTTSGFRAANRRCMEFLSAVYPEDYPEVESLVLLHKKGFSIIEVPVKMLKRAGGRSSISAGVSIYYMVKVLLAIFVDLLKRV
jgi:glycosyltransferase involved in cell wall biosynthesis